MMLICENSYRLKAVNYFRKKISSEMFGWVLNIPLIFKILREKPSRSLFHVKTNSQLTHSSRRTCSLCNICKSLLKVTFFVHFYFLESLNLRALVSSIWQYHILFLQLYLLLVEVCPLIKKGLRKHMDIQKQILAKSLIIQFHL